MKNLFTIKHLWFDFSDTIGKIDRDMYNKVLFESYGAAVGKVVNDDLMREYAEAFDKHKSNSAVFTSLGLPAGHLADCISTVDPKKLYTLTDEHIPAAIASLKDILPVSIFSNNKLNVILPSLAIKPEWFTHILGPDDVVRPKPALDGFQKMIALSKVEPEKILYIGDDVTKDLLPAKELGIMTGLLWSTDSRADYCFEDFQAILEDFSYIALP